MKNKHNGSLYRALEDIYYLYLEYFYPETEWLIEMSSWCDACKDYEFTELAKTRYSFIIETIVNNGKKSNRYIVTAIPSNEEV